MLCGARRRLTATSVPRLLQQRTHAARWMAFRDLPSARRRGRDAYGVGWHGAGKSASEIDCSARIQIVRSAGDGRGKITQPVDKRLQVLLVISPALD